MYERDCQHLLAQHILSDILPTWVSEESLVKASKRVGISSVGLNVDWMQTSKFEQADMLFGNSPGTSKDTSSVNDALDASASSHNCSLIASPKNCRSGTISYLKGKLANAEQLIQDIVNEKVSLKEVPGLFQSHRVRPVKKKKVRMSPKL